MATGRDPRPLFELLSTSPTRAVPGQLSEHPRQGPPTPELPPAQPERAATPPAPATERSDEQGSESYRRVTIPLPTVYAGLAFALVLAVVSGVVGYQVGVAAASGSIETPEPGVIQGLDSPSADPNASDSPRTAIDPASNTAGAGGTDPDRSTTPERRRTRVLTRNGESTVDPRTDGHNYLHLATLPEDAAIEGIRLLADAGIEAIAVRIDSDGGVDSRRGPRNTSPRFRLIGMDVSVPSDRFRRSADERAAYERRVREIGRRWAETGGASDFSSTNWAKYDGP